MPAKKPRPPTLSLETSKKAVSRTVIEFQTPIDLHSDSQEDTDDHLSSPSSSGSNSPIGYPLNLDADSDQNADELSRDLAVLEQLRRNVHKNLRLRPIRSSSASTSSSHKHQESTSSLSSDSPPSDSYGHRSPSPDSAISPDSAYFTPLSQFGATPLSARQITFSNHSRQVSLDYPQPPSRQNTSVFPVGVSPALLLSRLSAPTRPLLIDTRPIAAFLSSHLEHTINMAIPSLILKRSRKPAGAFQSLDALRQYITTDEGMKTWDDLMQNDDWDGDVIVYDEHMDIKDRGGMQASAWTLMDVIGPLLQHGAVDYLEGGFAAARRHPYLSQLTMSSSQEDDPSADDQVLTVPSDISTPNSGKRTPGGLRQLDTVSAARSKTYPEIEQAAPSPQPIMPAAMRSWTGVDDYTAPSPPPSSTVFSRPQPPRRPSIPALRKLDTSSKERLHPNLPKLQVNKPDMLSAPPEGRGGSRSRSRSPSHLKLIHSNHSPPGSARLLVSPDSNRPSTPHTPSTPMPPSPLTARPDTEQPPTEEPVPVFSVSTILPNFLYLGPELTTEEHVQELLSLGVKRILNIAIECDDDHGLRLKERFERYVRIPMRDTVEEDNITQGVREACAHLDDARLHSAPTYVHCKAGKSRSVTAVMAYLIHANHWTLARAYAFVVGRRKGISPNIGFVSELMTFEEQELGGKSVGVVKMPPSSDTSSDADSSESNGGGGASAGGNYQVALGGRRPQHIRESLPPAFTSQHSFNLVPTVGHVAQLGDSQQELEIKDAEGRYRHARRAPVDEATLQPMRRVSKAGLESSVYNFSGRPLDDGYS